MSDESRTYRRCNGRGVANCASGDHPDDLWAHHSVVRPGRAKPVWGLDLLLHRPRTRMRDAAPKKGHTRGRWLRRALPEAKGPLDDQSLPRSHQASREAGKGCRQFEIPSWAWVTMAASLRDGARHASSHGAPASRTAKARAQMIATKPHQGVRINSFAGP